MAAEFASIFFTNAMEHVSTVWVELLLASLAVIVYITLSNRRKSQKRSAQTGERKYARKSDQENFQAALKALRQGKLIEGAASIQRLLEAMEGQVPDELSYRLLVTAAKVPRVTEVIEDLRPLAGKISSQSLDMALMTATKSKDVDACRQLHMLSGVLSIPKGQAAFESLAKVYAVDANALRVLVEEANAPLARPFAEAALKACANIKDSNLAAAVFEKASDSDAASLRDFVEKLMANGGCDVGSSETTSAGDSETTSPEDTPRDNMQNVYKELRGLKEYAARNNDTKESAMRANDIRSCGKNGDLKGAVKVFDRLGDRRNNTLIINSMLDACVECKSLDKASEVFDEAKELHLADVISYNTMMKGFIANGQEAEAKKLLAELSERGLSATRSSYHGLLNARVNAKDFNGAWKLVASMQAAGIAPNAVTCSILLKGKLSSHSDVARVLTLVDSMDQLAMDEVLFLAIVEACIRTGRLDLLSRQTEKFMQQEASATLTAATYGSMIKAYGHARDVAHVWNLWEKMASNRVQPTPITLGCMVEALVANGRANEAWQLARETWQKPSTRPLVNTVIYSSILKGFAHAKDTEKVMALYEEMKAHKIQPNTITFNTILNAFAQGGAMHRVPALLEDMKVADPPVEPDIVTYSTIVKGFCNAGNLDRALKVLKDMKARGVHSPDEVMYNSLLGGCAKEHRPDEALQLLDDMRKYNVAPSNYTLSMLVKLMGRCKRINQAFTMLEDISREYGLKINIQVYTCLIQGCFNAGQASKAVTLYEKIVSENLVPDAMTYTVLVRGCTQGGLLDKACEFARAAHGVGAAPRKGSPPGLNAGGLDELLSALGPQEAKELQADVRDFKAPSAGGKGNRGKGTRDSGKGAGAASAPWRQQRA